MVVVVNFKTETINKEVQKSIGKTASELSDGYTGYANLKNGNKSLYCCRTRRAKVGKDISLGK